MEVKILLTYKNEREAETVEKAISPDNMEIPSDFSIRTMKKGSKVLTIIECQTGLNTLIATIDDLLACISIAEKIFTITKNPQSFE